MLTKTMLAATLMGLAALPASALDRRPDPMAITVNPSGFTGETIDEKLARRMRESDYLFRAICRGCVRQEASAAPGGTFDPQATLDGSRRGR